MIQKKWFAVIATVIGILLGFGMSQTVQFQEVTAEPQDDGFSELRKELDALKAKQRALQAKWQAALLAQVVPTLTYESESVKRDFVDFLEELGGPSVPALAEMLQDPAERVRREAGDALGEIGEDLRKKGESTAAIRDALIASLADESSRVRKNGVNELSDIRETSMETFAALIDALTDTSTSVRNSAEAALIELGRRAATTATPLVAEALENGTSPVTRGHIVDVLGGIGEKTKAASDSRERITQTLIAALQDPDANVRRNAADELGEMRATSPDVLPALTGALEEDSAKNVREAARKAIKRIEKSR